MFVQGMITKPLIVGLMWQPQNNHVRDKPLKASIDNERVVLQAEKEIVMQCGESSITLTKAGKIIVRGRYILSRSTGVNRIKGGSVQIN